MWQSPDVERSRAYQAISDVYGEWKLEGWSPEAIAEAEQRLAINDADIGDSTVHFADFALQVLDRLDVVDPYTGPGELRAADRSGKVTFPNTGPGEGCVPCQDEPVIVWEQQDNEYEAIRYVYAEAFRRPGFRPPQDPGSFPPEVGLFEALWEAGDAIPEFSFTALADGGVVGHVTASQATIATDPVVAVGPIGVLPDLQGNGIGNGLMDALLAAADAADMPSIGLLGAPEYCSRFGLRPAQELVVIPPEPESGDAFQARPLTAYGVCGRTISVRAGLLVVNPLRVTLRNAGPGEQGVARQEATAKRRQDSPVEHQQAAFMADCSSRGA